MVMAKSKAIKMLSNPLYSPLVPYKYNPFRAIIKENNLKDKLTKQITKQVKGLEYKKTGRPNSMTGEVLGKLKYAYLSDATDAMACFYSGISVDVLYKYQREHPEFIKMKEMWKLNPVLKAKNTVFKSIELGDVNTSKWLLERKLPKEYGNKLQVDHDHVHKLDDYQLKQMEQEIITQIAAAAGYHKIEDTQEAIDVTPDPL